MQEQSSNVEILFIPERLNKAPSVYRGMTLIELMIVAGIGVCIGAVLGILTMFLFNLDWAMIPTGMLVFGFISIRFGGFALSRLKRGKPEAWLARYLEFRFFSSRFITKSDYWSIKRSAKRERL
ncbi:TIGR03750 family conjugal transfer protein [Actinobacillus porcinus]|uniref:TIGR03750 family conjugal transfer protein n=1 Tax=Actinobacillus porcinus TaxID=51048 RepID=UPI002354A690|nr:TIGR03750 family conjugal transfer protein [Actinobacillus porcinus]MCI5764581.1 TIGR03750 family conjugal transfer protein [Actinobacillus porcinus]MDY5421386.1 TIGR03750 family conjugal transfer protein [Actinobacillus porcinus]